MTEKKPVYKIVFGASSLPPPMFCHNNHSEIVNDWFYDKCADDVSPANSVCILTSLFNRCLFKLDLELCMDYKRFRNSVCNAVCLYAYNDFFGSKGDIGVPINIQKFPKGWNSETEFIWQDYIQTFHLNFEFWEKFWKLLPHALWENRFPNLRNYLQSIMIYYIKYNNELLIENELIAINNDGDYVDPSEVDYESEDDDESKWN